jgi:hypothetical protein
MHDKVQALLRLIQDSPETAYGVASNIIATLTSEERRELRSLIASSRADLAKRTAYINFLEQENWWNERE